MYFPDTQFVDRVVTKLAPILFTEYEDGVADFAYLGGHQGSAKLESALAQPRQTFAGEFLYPTMADKAAALAWSIAKNHPFVDGNKRAALITANLFLLANKHVLLATHSDALTICIRIAGGDGSIELADVSQWFAERIVSIDDNIAERVNEFLSSASGDHFADPLAMSGFIEVLSAAVRSNQT